MVERAIKVDMAWASTVRLPGRQDREDSPCMTRWSESSAAGLLAGCVRYWIFPGRGVGGTPDQVGGDAGGAGKDVFTITIWLW